MRLRSPLQESHWPQLPLNILLRTAPTYENIFRMIFFKPCRKRELAVCAFSTGPFWSPWANRQTRPRCRCREHTRSISDQLAGILLVGLGRPVRIENLSVPPDNLSSLRIDFPTRFLADCEPLFRCHLLFRHYGLLSRLFVIAPHLDGARPRKDDRVWGRRRVAIILHFQIRQSGGQMTNLGLQKHYSFTFNP